MKIGYFKFLLLVLIYLFGTTNSYARVCLNDYGWCQYLDVIKEMCSHNYSMAEITDLEKSADKGNVMSQLKLGIIYDIKSVERYNQAVDSKKVAITTGSIAARYWTKRKSPCDPTHEQIQGRY